VSTFLKWFWLIAKVKVTGSENEILKPLLVQIMPLGSKMALP